MSSSSPARPITLADVAAEADVSRMTASRVMRNARGVSPRTRERVREVADRLGYVPDRIAAAFGSESPSTLIGIALPTLGRDLYAQILEGLETRLSAVGYQPMVGVVGHDDEAEHRWLMSALAWRPGGIVVAGRARGEAMRTLLQSVTVPVVELWNLLPEGRQQRRGDPLRVGFDHRAAGLALAEYLAARYSGPIGYVGAAPDGTVLGADRLAGLRDGLRLARGEGERVREHVLRDRSSFYAGFYGTEQLLSAHPDVRVIHYLDDAMATGGLMYCQRCGLKIPGDIAIAGFGGLDIGSVLPIRLTTLGVPRLRVGKLAAELLLKRIDGAPADATRDVGFELVKGETA